jgi:prevent-host-death family protein
LIRDRRFGEHVFVDNPNQKGNVAELAIATEAARLGLSVLKPLTEHERYDLALAVDGRLLRVQCKWGALRDGVIAVRVSSSYHSPTRGYVKTTYDGSEIDAIGVYCGDLDRCYLLPVDLVAGRGMVHLRVERAKNNQRAALNWAADYELGAVAQLAERPNGIREAEGSNPSSSTPDSQSTTTPIEVGAHKFRNHFGYYMERAAGGTEIVIRRHGTPYARLSPAKRADSYSNRHRVLPMI